MKDVFETATVQFAMTGRTGTEQVFHSGQRAGVTPPEFKILQLIHKKENVQIIEVTGPALEFVSFDKKGKETFRPRDEDEEKDRLRSWYGKTVYDNAYPQDRSLPFTFAEARIPTSIPDNVADIGKRKTPAKPNQNATSETDTVEDDDGFDDLIDKNSGQK